MTTILITNDDGIHSPGLRAAAEAVSFLGTIIIIAPSSQQKGTGRGLFGDKDLCLIPAEYIVNNKNVEAYHCNCSPALIVRHSLRTILKDSKPDLLISGINYGENLGFNITSSGTVGAALEGKVDESIVEKDSDIYAIFKERLVSVTPISLDVTSRVEFQELHEMLDA